MSRTQSLLFAAMLMSSGTAFAADTIPPASEKPGPSAGAVTSGSNPGVASGVSRDSGAGLPSDPPAADPTMTENKSKLPVPGANSVPSPGEVNKNKPQAQ
jgi:hypothetical protein